MTVLKNEEVDQSGDREVILEKPCDRDQYRNGQGYVIYTQGQHHKDTVQRNRSRSHHKDDEQRPIMQDLRE